MSRRFHPLVLIPSFNTGPRLLATIEEALAQGFPVWVVIDGSTDGSAEPAKALARREPRLRVIVRPRNGGKGAAIATGVDDALAAGYSHALTMDADGQHPAQLIPSFLEAARQSPSALILGRPVFGPEAPLARLQGRKLSVALARLEILGRGIDDPLFGFRVYPLEPLARVFTATRWARRFDFDHEAAVRLVWLGTPAVNLPAPCRYLGKAEGGVSHFRYGRDNAVLVWLHTRLIVELLFRRWPRLLRLRRRARIAAALLALAALAVPVGRAQPRETEIAIDRDPGWLALLQRLHPIRDRQAPFEERRFFPFRRSPVVLTGTVRLAPGRGLSLGYERPLPRVVIIDAAGVLIRGESGERAAPADPHLTRATEALAAVLRFDPVEMERQFVVRGRRDRDGWSLELVPRDSDLAALFASIQVEGSGGRLRRIALVTSPTQRIEILLGEPRDDLAFGAAELRRYFR